MKFSSKLIEAKLIQRYKRFLADVEIADGSQFTVHCPNPGSMMGLKEPGSRVWISKSDNPKRKLSHTLELIEIQGDKQNAASLVGVNTNLPNKIAEEAILAGNFPQFGPFDELRREVKYGENSRIDILLSTADANSPDDESKMRKTYIEVKSVTLQRQSGLHEFPDGVTERGRKHLGELAKMVEAGNRAVMLYLIQRQDGDRLSFARDIDPRYAEAFDDAISRGVEAIAIDCKITAQEIIADRVIEIDEPIIRQMK